MEMDKLDFDFFVFRTLEQRNPISRETLHRILEKAHFRRVFIDLTLRGNHYSREVLDYSMRKSNIVKMNEDEARVVNNLFCFDQTDLKKLIPAIANEFDIEVVCITLGERGALIGDKTSAIHEPPYKTEVKDTVRNGDGFSAGLLYIMGEGASPSQACKFGNKMGALIASKRSSIPHYQLSELDAM
jgi:fructokinase